MQLLLLLHKIRLPDFPISPVCAKKPFPPLHLVAHSLVTSINAPLLNVLLDYGVISESSHGGRNVQPGLLRTDAEAQSRVPWDLPVAMEMSSYGAAF